MINLSKIFSNHSLIGFIQNDRDGFFIWVLFVHILWHVTFDGDIYFQERIPYKMTMGRYLKMLFRFPLRMSRKKIGLCLSKLEQAKLIEIHEDEWETDNSMVFCSRLVIRNYQDYLV